MNYYVYILFSAKLNRYYIGQTNNVPNRLKIHNSGYEKFTSRGIPWKLVYYEEVDSRAESMKLEKKLKNLKSQKRIEEYIEKGIKESRGCRGIENL